MSSIQINGTQLHYYVLGEGIPTVIIHGWGVDHRLMSGCLEPVFTKSKAMCKRIYIDLPGMGESTPGPDIKDSHDVLRVIYALLENLIPEQSFILVGESYGGYLARGIVKEHPDKVLGLLLLCPAVLPGYRTGTTVPLEVMERDDAFLSTLTKEEFDSFTYMNVRLTKEVWERYKEQVQSGIQIQNTYFLNNVLEGSFLYDVDQLDIPFNGPALFITGKQDTEVGYVDQFELQKKYKNATYITLAASGHNAQIEQPEIFTGVVLGWLERYFAH